MKNLAVLPAIPLLLIRLNKRRGHWPLSFYGCPRLLVYYQSYGEWVKKEVSNSRQWFTGKSQNERLGLSYFGARWYDPSVGRFINPDPVDGIDRLPEHAFNRYAYANNNPYRYADPDGREPTQSQAVTWARARSVIIGRGYASGKLWDKTVSVEDGQAPHPTSWSYEDAPSNQAGLVFFLDYYNGDGSLVDSLNNFFSDAGAAAPSSAPNWGNMQKKKTLKSDGLIKTNPLART